MIFIWCLVFHDNDDDDKDDQLMTVHDRSHRVWWCCCWSHGNQLMGFPNAFHLPHIHRFYRGSANGRSTKQQRTNHLCFHRRCTVYPCYLQRCVSRLVIITELPWEMGSCRNSRDTDGSWWLHCNWLKSPKQQSTQTWAPTLKQTHLKNTQWYTMWYIAMASTCRYFRMLGHQWWNGGWILSLNIYFIRNGSLLKCIQTTWPQNTNCAAPKNWWIHSCRALSWGILLPSNNKDPGSRNLPACEFQQQTSSNNLTKWNNKSHATLTINSYCNFFGVLKSSSEMN